MARSPRPGDANYAFATDGNLLDGRLSMGGDAALMAEKRNGWILDHCDEAAFASLDPNGSLARLVTARPNPRYQLL